MNLGKRYSQAVLYPSIVVLVAMTVFSIAENHNYKSNWLDPSSAISSSISGAFLYCLIMCVLALPIFLNRMERVRSNGLLIVLSWFLLPFCFIGIIIVDEVRFTMQYEEGRLGIDYIYILLLNLPFIAGLTWSYLKHHRSCSTQY